VVIRPDAISGYSQEGTAENSEPAPKRDVEVQTCNPLEVLVTQTIGVQASVWIDMKNGNVAEKGADVR
jgi:hypothetical protein